MREPTAFTTDWRRLRQGKYVGVDCDYSSAQLTLSHHWYGQGTPAAFRHDLAAGAALAWAASPERSDYLGKAQYVYNDHFDVDGFLAAWAALNPDEALEHRAALLQAAASGDFDEWTTEGAVKFAILGELVDDPRFSTLAREAFSLPRRAADEALYNAVLAELPDLLYHPEKYEGLWRPTYDETVKQRALFTKGRARVEERLTSHLSVVHTPRILQARAAIAETKGDRLLQVVDTHRGFMYMFRYRPYLGYRIVSRSLTPVHDTAVLARELNARWPTEGEKWRLVGSWSRKLVLTAEEGGRRQVPRTPPEVSVPILEAVLGSLDEAHPRARMAYDS